MSRPNQQAPGYMGDPTRGASMGRASNYGRPAQTTGRFNLMRVRLDAGGYDAGGAYWGSNSPGNVLYYYSDASGAVDGYLRAADREDAKRRVRATYPLVTFYR